MNEDPPNTRQALHSYPPSWVDRLTAWVQHLPLPTLAVYLMAGLAALLLFVFNDSG